MSALARRERFFAREREEVAEAFRLDVFDDFERDGLVFRVRPSILTARQSTQGELSLW